MHVYLYAIIGGDSCKSMTELKFLIKNSHAWLQHPVCSILNPVYLLLSQHSTSASQLDAFHKYLSLSLSTFLMHLSNWSGLLFCKAKQSRRLSEHRFYIQCSAVLKLRMSGSLSRNWWAAEHSEQVIILCFSARHTCQSGLLNNRQNGLHLQKERISFQTSNWDTGFF